MTENNAGAEDATPHKEIVIIVNAERKTVLSRVVSYDEVVALAYPTPPSPDTRFTAVEPNREGSLVEGQSVTAKEGGTIFNVRATNKS